MKKRILSFALALCFVLTLLPAAFADSETPNGVCGDNLTWVLANGVLTISGTGEMYDYDWGTAPWYEFKDEVTKLVIEQGATSIGDQTFIGLTKLADVQLPGGIVSIGEEAFYSCESLKSVVIPEGTKSIGVSAFGMCSSLESVTLPDSLTTIEVYAFARCNLKSFTIPSGWTEFDQDVIYSNDALESINVSAGNSAYSSENGVLFNKDKTELIMYPMGKTDSSYTIPSSVTDISYYALQGGKFKSVTIPSTVESIGTYAFAQCKNLEKITIPDSVTSMYDSVFCECTALTTASLPKSVSSISYGTFDSCTSLKSVNIPSGVKSIEDRAFNDCTSLSDIYFGGSSAQWKTVTVGADNNGLNKATVHYAQHTHSYKNGKCTRCGAADPKYIAAPALKITTVSGHPKIYWNSVDGAYKYWIYRSTDGKNFKYYDRTSKTSYTNNATNVGTLYYYKVKAVKAVDGKDVASVYSNTRSIRCKPAAPKLTLTRSAGKPKLSWNSVKGADKYWIYRSTDGTNYKYYDSTTKTTYTNNSTTIAQRYWYKVKAVKVVNGNNYASVYSNSDFVWVSTKAPTLKITTYKGDPKITWNSVSGAKLYWVFVSTDGKTYYFLNETKNTSYIDKNVKAGKKYYYKVQAVALYNGTFAIPSAYSYPVSITAK